MNASQIRKFLEQRKAELLFLGAISSMVGGVVNFYLGSKLLPFAARQDAFDFRVSAIEASLSDRPEYRERFIKVEQQTAETREDVKEIKESQVRQEEKIDRLLERSQ